MQTETTTKVQEGRIHSITFHFDSRVTLWLTGGDSMTDHFPAYHHISQKMAKVTIDEIGIWAGCRVEGTNYRDAGEAMPADHVRAQKFAKSVGIEFRDKVIFPKRERIVEAQEDMKKEPALDLVVIFIGRGFALNSDIFRENLFQTVTREEAASRQIIAEREAVAS